MKAWKNAEKQVAKLLGGIRRVRVAYSESIEDVLHKKFAIEVKYGKQVPKWVVNVKPLVCFNDEFDFVVISSKDINKGKTYKVVRKRVKFVMDGLSQALQYDKSKKKKIPLLCLKPTRYRGIIFCVMLRHYGAFKKLVSSLLEQ